MKPLFSKEGNARLDAIIREGVLCVFDFDGTLAPIVPQPDAAHLPVAVRQQLLRLQQLAPVAILTGRALEDIAGRLAFTPDFMVGNHGLEGLPESGKRRSDFALVCDTWRQALQQALSDHGRFDPAILMEDKTISLSVHYRHAEDQARAERELEHLFAGLVPLPRVIAGKCVFNLLPQGAGDKGTAFEQLMTLSGATTALYVGDDVTDEDVFRLTRNDLLSVRIGETGNSAAAFFLRRHADIIELLENLIERLSRIGKLP